MKKPLLAALAITLALFSIAQTDKAQIAIIPQPVSVVMGTGSFKLPADFTIITGNNPDVKRIAGFLATTLSTATGNHVAVKEGSGAASKSIFLSLTADKAIAKEGYRLKSGADGL